MAVKTLKECIAEQIPAYVKNLPDASPGETGMDTGGPVFIDSDGATKVVINVSGVLKKCAVDEGIIKNARLLAHHRGLAGILESLEMEIDDGKYELQEASELIGAHTLVSTVLNRSTSERELLRPLLCKGLNPSGN